MSYAEYAESEKLILILKLCDLCVLCGELLTDVVVAVAVDHLHSYRSPCVEHCSVSGKNYQMRTDSWSMIVESFRHAFCCLALDTGNKLSLDFLLRQMQLLNCKQGLSDD